MKRLKIDDTGVICDTAKELAKTIGCAQSLINYCRQHHSDSKNHFWIWNYGITVIQEKKPLYYKTPEGRAHKKAYREKYYEEHRDIIICGDGWSMAIDIIPETVNNICWKNVEKWCYLDDLLELETELERTRKALDVAVKRLGYIKNNYKSWTLDRDAQMIAQAVNGLDEIKTALEQKDN